MVGAQRPAQFAKYLPEFGWRALVVCSEAGRRGVLRRSDLESEERGARAALAAADPLRSVIVPTGSLAYDGSLDRLWRSTARAGARPFA